MVNIDKIKELSQEKGLSLSFICKKLGVARVYFNDIIKTQRDIPDDRLKIIAELLDTTPEFLRDETDIKERYLSPRVTEDIVTFPVIGEIAAGYNHMAEEGWEGEVVDIPVSYLHGRPQSDYFVLKVKGDSMYPAYMDGDNVLILKQSTLNRSGEIGAVIYDGELATLKKIEYVNGEDWMKMIPLNPNYPPRTIENADLERCRVIGVPILLIREIKQ